MEVIRDIAELEARGWFVVDDDDFSLENRIEYLLEDRGLSMSDLARLTGMSRQSIHAAMRKNLKPNVEFGLKIAHVLGVHVEDIFYLTDSAWLKPPKMGKESFLYLNVMTMELLNSNEKREQLAITATSYHHVVTREMITAEEYKVRFQEYLAKQLEPMVAAMRAQQSSTSLHSLRRQAREQLEVAFPYQGIYKKVGKPMEPLVVKQSLLKRG
jgi:putative transcriptional regulator